MPDIVMWRGHAGKPGDPDRLFLPLRSVYVTEKIEHDGGSTR
jgi:hypothetical protein